MPEKGIDEQNDSTAKNRREIMKTVTVSRRRKTNGKSLEGSNLSGKEIKDNNPVT